MSLTCISQIALECTTGSSDKLYIIQVQHDTSTGDYFCVGYSGRRGSALAKQPKYTGKSSAIADATATKLEREKRSKSGYVTHPLAAGVAPVGMPSGTPVFGGASVASPSAGTTTPATPVITGPLPMLAEAIDEARAMALLEDPDWGLQKKYDGERVPVSLRRSDIQATNRKGFARPLTDVTINTLKKLLTLPDFMDDRETSVDGELMGDEYVIYDITKLRDNDVTKLSCEERYAALEAMLENHLGLLAPMAWSTAEKKAMFAQAQAESWEGLIFRNLTTGYVVGYCPNLLKFKLWATCTCRVLTTNAKRSVEIALMTDDGVEESVGNVSVPVNQDIPEVDSLIEVRYLYALPGGSLYQPTMLRPRTDIDNADLRSNVRQAPPEKLGTLPLAA